MTTSHLIHDMIRHIREVPEYFIALKAGVAVVAMGIPVYAGLRYFLYRRQLKISVWVTFNFVGSFILFGGLAFVLASPLAFYVSGPILTGYLFITCVSAAMGAVSLIDVFLVHHYLTQVKHVYISPPLRAVIKVSVFCVVLLPILRYVLDFNPLALIAIPTILTAATAFALQDTLKTFIAGLALGHNIRLGQWISFQGQDGEVLDVSWARTTIENADGVRIMIPNSMLHTGIFMKYPGGSPAIIQTFKIHVPYEVDPERVKKTLLAAVKGSGIAASPAPLALLNGYTEAGISYVLVFWVDDYTQRGQRIDEVGTRVWHAFQREGLSISYPSRTVLMSNGAEGVKAKRSSSKKI
jgi:small-conductance mechanosensitive channel